MIVRDRDIVSLDPRRIRHPLGSEGLQVLDRVVRGIFEKGLNKIKAFVVGDVGGGLRVSFLSIGILYLS